MCDCYIFENWACKIRKVNFYAKIENFFARNDANGLKERYIIVFGMDFK